MTPALRKVAIDVAKAYLTAPPLSDGRSPVGIEAELDKNRAEVIERDLRPLLSSYLGGKTTFSDFKRQVDGINKRHGLWGFRGTKGQMFFNLLTNAIEDLPNKDQLRAEFDERLKFSIKRPDGNDDARAILKNSENYVVRICQDFIEAGGDARGKPNASSIGFFLSYFWQIQEPNVWPVYYTSAVQTIESLNLWRPIGDIGEDYVEYKKLHEELSRLFNNEFGRPFSLYDVEHVFWFKSGRLAGEENPAQRAAPGTAISPPQPKLIPASPATEPLLDGYVPPIVTIIPRLAANEPALQESAQLAGTTVERALEKNINAALTMLGYETRLLGQGKGRVPDGQAIAHEESYALLWDAKARSEGYRMGTDDRTIREYIDRQSLSLKRSRGIRNIYYVIFSSGFVDEFEELVRSLKMNTHVNEVCFVEAVALVELLNQKLRAPLVVGLGSDGIQRLFSSSGIITSADVLELLNV